MVLLTVALLLASGPGENRVSIEGFTFRIPDGWASLSAADQQAAASALPPELARLARTGSYALVAADPDGAADGFAENPPRSSPPRE